MLTARSVLLLMRSLLSVIYHSQYLLMKRNRLSVSPEDTEIHKMYWLMRKKGCNWGAEHKLITHTGYSTEVKRQTRSENVSSSLALWDLS